MTEQLKRYTVARGDLHPPDDARLIGVPIRAIEYVYLASDLATALRNMPCLCVVTGSWPRFKADVKAHPERTCKRCKALAAYDAHVAIVQRPGVRP